MNLRKPGVAMRRQFTDPPEGKSEQPGLKGRIPPLLNERIHDADTFKSILERERSLAYRHGRHFSLLEMNMNNGNRHERYVHELAKALAGRVRCTDVLGRCGPFGLAAILAETSRDDAIQLGKEVCAKLEGICPPPDCTVDVCPELDAGRKPGISVGVPLDKSRAGDGSDLSRNGVDALLFPAAPRWKRVLDVALSIPILVALGPVMLLTALLIKCVSRGPVLFKQERVGYLGKPFTLYKFRTMHHKTRTDVHQQHLAHLIESDAPMEKLDQSQDPRLIPLGRWIRATALDELPQLYNVLRGDMSLVGPRPSVQYEFDRYELWQRRRCDTLPGLTGVWQVSGKNRLSFSTMMRQDVGYAQRKSLSTDLKTIALTVPAVLKEIRSAANRRKDKSS